MTEGPNEGRDDEPRGLRTRLASYLERLVTSQADPAVTEDPPPGSEPPAAG
jgi:hypothetical protein